MFMSRRCLATVGGTPADESTSEEEDEDGALLTPQVERKLLKVLNLIKRKDPKIYDPKKVFFKDSDFEQADTAEKVNM